MIFYLGPNGFYILENLQPRTTYDFRFGSKNLVGFSEWGAGKQLTMPQRGPPEKPRINILVSFISSILFCFNLLKRFKDTTRQLQLILMEIVAEVFQKGINGEVL